MELEPLVAKKNLVQPKGHVYKIFDPPPEKRPEVKGAASPIRQKQAQKMMFVVRLDKGTDPGSFRLLVFESEKRYRWVKSVPPMHTADLLLPLNVIKYGESSYGLTPASQLMPGEYAFAAGKAMQFYCFGVGEVTSGKRH